MFLFSFFSSFRITLHSSCLVCHSIKHFFSKTDMAVKKVETSSLISFKELSCYYSPYSSISIVNNSSVLILVISFAYFLIVLETFSYIPIVSLLLRYYSILNFNYSFLIQPPSYKKAARNKVIEREYPLDDTMQTGIIDSIFATISLSHLPCVVLV